MSEYRIKRRKIFLENKNEDNINKLIDILNEHNNKINFLINEINRDLKNEINKINILLKENNKLIKDNLYLKDKDMDKEMCNDMKNAYL